MKHRCESDDFLDILFTVKLSTFSNDSVVYKIKVDPSRYWDIDYLSAYDTERHKCGKSIVKLHVWLPTAMYRPSG